MTPFSLFCIGFVLSDKDKMDNMDKTDRLKSRKINKLSDSKDLPKP